MPGPTTEVLNDDIREVKGDLRDLRSGLDMLKTDVHAIALDLAELRAEFRVTIGVAKWAASLVVATLLTGGITGGVAAVWWASTVSADVRRLATDVADLKKAAEPPKAIAPAPGPKPTP